MTLAEVIPVSLVAQIEEFEPVKLVFAWTNNPKAPLSQFTKVRLHFCELKIKSSKGFKKNKMATPFCSLVLVHFSGLELLAKNSSSWLL